MQCEQFEARLQELLDERRPLDSDPHLIAHSLGCEPCSAQVAISERLLLGLDLAEYPPLRAGFAESVVGTAVNEQAPNVGSWCAIWNCLALAAALLLITYMLPRPSPPQPFSFDGLVIIAPSENTDSLSPLLTLVDDLAERFPADRAAKAIQRLDHAARPITNSFGSAFTAIYRTVEQTRIPNKSADVLDMRRNRLA